MFGACVQGDVLSRSLFGQVATQLKGCLQQPIIFFGRWSNESNVTLNTALSRSVNRGTVPMFLEIMSPWMISDIKSLLAGKLLALSRPTILVVFSFEKRVKGIALPVRYLDVCMIEGKQHTCLSATGNGLYL